MCITANHATSTNVDGVELSVRISYNSTGFCDDKRSSSNIPCMNSLLVVDIKGTTSNVAHIEGSGACATESTAVLEDDFDISKNPIESRVRAVVRESSGSEAVLQRTVREIRVRNEICGENDGT